MPLEGKILGSSTHDNVNNFGIKHALDFYSRRLDVDIDIVNIQLSHTKVPAIAVSGTKMKEDLREIKSRLESINLQ